MAPSALSRRERRVFLARNPPSISLDGGIRVLDFRRTFSKGRWLYHSRFQCFVPTGRTATPGMSFAPFARLQPGSSRRHEPMIGVSIPSQIPPARRLRWWQTAVPPVVAAILLGLGIANIRMRATWQEAEDGVLWVARPQGVVAREIAAGTPAQQVGLAPGDVLLAIDGKPVRDVDDVVRALHGGRAGTELRYTILRLGAREVVDVALAPIPNGPAALYFFMAAVGVFTLVVGALVRMRRPRDPATLHFFWLSVAFFGVFT